MNRENLQTLATFLAYGSSPVGFDMDVVYKETQPCGTVCCAAGFGPLAGVKKSPRENWVTYAMRSFVSGADCAFDWCFNAMWATVDNTRLGAAKRIQFLIDNDGKLPDWNYSFEAVALYANTEVKREHPQNGVVRPVAERPHRLIAELLDKIKREPKSLVKV